MSSTSNPLLLIVGSGPGIGRAVAKRFSEHFKTIVLISRTQSNLDADKKEIESSTSGSSVHTFALDAGDLTALNEVLPKISKLGNLECVFYNAARVRPSPLLEDPTSEIEYDFRITSLALYEVAKWAMPQLTALASSNPEARPSLLVTSSLLHMYPIPPLFSLSMTKAAQRNLVESLAKTYGKKGVHCGLISVGGRVDPKFETLNPTVIAERTWGLFREERGGFTFDADIIEGV